MSQLVLASSTIWSEEHTSELQSQSKLVCRLLLEKKNKSRNAAPPDVVGEDGEQAAVVRTGEALAPVAQRRGVLDQELHLEAALFFFNDAATTEIYTLSLHDALPI